MRPIDPQRGPAFFDMEDAACFTFKRAEVGQSREALRPADQSHLLSAAWALRPLRCGAVGTLGIHDGAPLSAAYTRRLAIRPVNVAMRALE